MKSHEEYLTYREASELVEKSIDSLRKLVSRRILTAIKRPGSNEKLLRKQEVMAYFALPGEPVEK